METTLQNLLTQISAIIKKYEEIAEITGENFNVFRVLRVETSEVRMHSAFLAELLNPQGSHGQRDAFLKTFIRAFNISGFESLDIGDVDAEVIVEEYVGRINEDYTEGGRIDIVIKPQKGRIIVIENKIYAGDQYNQLIRYHNEYPDAHLLYLTLDGKDADKSSIQDMDKENRLVKDKHYFPVSYKKDILKWLVQCRKEAVGHPILRETITQYINLIKYLTGQTINDNMKEKIVSLISTNEENLKVAFDIFNNLDNVKQKLMADFEKQMSEIKVKHGLELSIYCEPYLGAKESGFYFYRPNWKKFKIGLVFDSNGANDFFYGICGNDKNLVLSDKILNELGTSDGNSEHWPWWKWYEIRHWYSNSEPWIEIANGKMKRKIQAILEDMLIKLKVAEL